MIGLLLLMICYCRPSLAGAEDERLVILRRSSPAYGLAWASYQRLPNGSECREQLATFRRAVDDRIIWALKLLDSSGEPKPGFMYGNNYWLGVRSQCLDSMNKSPFILNEDVMTNNSRFRDYREEFPPYEVHYFVVHFRHDSTLQYHVRLPNEDLVTLGLCLPASCSTDELSTVLESMFREKTMIVGDLYSANYKIIEVRDLKDDRKWLFNFSTLITSVSVVIIIVLMLLGTIYDLLVHQKTFVKGTFYKIEKGPNINENNNVLIKLANEFESTNNLEMKKVKTMPGFLGKILLCFSVYSNAKLIFITKLSNKSIPPIHGMRFLGMVWIIMIHTIFYMSDYAENKAWSWRMAEGFAAQIVSNSTFSVDTFFFLSGFLIAYMYLTTHKNDRPTQPNYRLKITEFIVTVARRFIRLTPAYMVMVGILQVSSAWYGKTSQFYMTERPQELCKKYWWRNILYINNLFGRESMCMSWSWYLSNDMQFFVIGEFLLILSSVFYYAAIGILIVLLICSIFVTSYIAYINNLVPTIDQQYHMLDIVYDPPWTRIGPYIVGMLTAFIFIRLNKKLPIRRKTAVVCWLCGSSCNFIVLFGLYKRQLPVVLSALYIGFSRTIWAIGIAWIIIACCTKHGGIVNKILCFKTWIPLSRLTYCAYLLNPFLINLIYLHSESSVHVDFLPNVTMFLGYLVMTYICSFALSLMLETPTVQMMRTFIKIKKR